MKHHSAQREYWRSLEHLADSPLLRQMAENEFSSYDPDEMLKMPELTRRKFMRLAAASMALAGVTLTGCRRWPEEKLAPYTSNRPNIDPGSPLQYATIMEIDGVGWPLLVTSYDGRPIKVEGNPSHPAVKTAENIGASTAQAQASVLDVYDPDRSRGVLSGGQPSDWDSFMSAFGGILSAFSGNSGDGLAILAEPSAGPSAQRLRAAVASKFPKSIWCSYAPLVSGNETAGIKQATGNPARVVLSLNNVKTIVSLDADLLGSHPDRIRCANEWAAGRRSADNGMMSRVYVAETSFSTTGTIADVRLPVKPSRLGAILAALAIAAGVGSGASAPSLSPEEKNFVDGVNKDLFQAGATESVNPPGFIAVGEHLPPEFHALALAINAKIGAIGPAGPVTLLDRPDDSAYSLKDLTDGMKSGKITALIILGGNPVYDASADLDLAGSLSKVATTVHLSIYNNETSQLCKWHIPRAHYLESWSDARTWDGTVSICQPLIQPLFNGMTCEQVLALVAGESPIDSDAIVRKTFAALLPSDGFDLTYRKVLNDGLVPSSGYPVLGATVINSSVSGAAAVNAIAKAIPAASGMEICFLPDHSLYDGRYAGNGWLQELPDPLTKVVWDNPVIVSVDDARDMGVSMGDMLNVTVNGRSLVLPAYVLPGQPNGVIGLHLGYGRSAAGHIGTGVGFNTYLLRATGQEYFSSATANKTGDSYSLATTQNQQLIDDLGQEGRDDRTGSEKYSDAVLVREALFSDYAADPKLFQRNQNGSLPLQLFDPRPEPELDQPHKWGMGIDMTACIGCHACVAACQAENNIPIVGKDQVINDRQMHWIRIDRYFKGSAEKPEVVYQPMTCQMCENAPCEQVCPVGATMHDTEGLNVMVYNRCVGTRYCSNNCPYKVRRFNFLDYHCQDPRHDKYPVPFLNLPDLQDMQQVDKLQAMVFNPQVTVRMRGVMEKCTYCIQRIHTTQIAKRNAGIELQDGDIVTACQQACPTQAIVFGDLNDPSSKVSQWHRNNRAYAMLEEELNTRPRNRYLAKISNPPQRA